MELSKVIVPYVEYFILIKEDSQSPPRFEAGPFTDLKQADTVFSELEAEGEMVLLGLREATAVLEV